MFRRVWPRIEDFLLPRFAAVVKPCAWLLLLGGIVTFLGVLFGFIVVGEAKPATLLIAADMVVGGFSAVQHAQKDEIDEERGDAD